MEEKNSPTAQIINNMDTKNPVPNVITVSILILLIGMRSISYAEEAESATGTVKEKKDALLILNQGREGIRRNIKSITQKIDEYFFKDRDYLELEDKIKLRLELFKEEGRGLEFRTRVNVYIYFPILAIVVSNYKTDDLPSAELGDKEEISTGFSHYLLKLRKLVLSLGYGITFHDQKLVYYSRLKLLKHSIKVKNWNASLHQSVFWYSDFGFGELTEIDFDRPISEKMLFRSISAGLYSETSRGFELEQSFILTYDLIKKERVIFGRVSGFAHTEPYFDVDKYKTDIVYRVQLINPWMFFDIVPQVEFPVYRNFEAIPGIRFGIDSIF